MIERESVMVQVGTWGEDAEFRKEILLRWKKREEVAAASKVNPKQQKQAVELITNGLLEGAAEGGEERGQSNSLISWLINDVTTLQETVLQTLAEKDNEITSLETLYNTLIAGMKEDLQKLTKTLEARDAHIEQLKLHVEIANSAVCEHKQQIEHSEKEQTTSEKDSNAVEKKTTKKVNSPKPPNQIQTLKMERHAATTGTTKF